MTLKEEFEALKATKIQEHVTFSIDDDEDELSLTEDVVYDIIEEDVDPLVESIEGDPEEDEEEMKEVEGLSILLLTSSTDSKHRKMGKKNPTILKIEAYCKKNDIPYYTAFADTCYIDKNDDGDLTIHNEGDEGGFHIDRDKTFVIARRSVLFHKYSSNLVAILERYRFCFLNEIEAIRACEDKYLTVLKLQEAAIPTPRSCLVPTEDLIAFAHKKVGGGWPVIVKTLSGTQGIGVFMANDMRSLKSTMQTIWGLGGDTELMFQEYIEAQYDVRCHVLGDKVIASMKRVVVPEDFRSNVHLGGQTMKYKPTAEIQDLAVKAAKALKCRWAGIDIIFDKQKNPYILEVNSSPGTDGIEAVNQIDVVSMVMDYIKNAVNWSRPPQEVGVLETIKVDGLGELPARFDTGNRASSSSLDAQDIQINDGTVTWSTKGTKMTGKLMDHVKLKNNFGAEEDVDRRPVVSLDVKFDGVKYRDVLFNLCDRSHKSTPVLINRDLMVRSGSVVNPAKIYLVTQKPKVDKRKKKGENKEDREEN